MDKKARIYIAGHRGLVGSAIVRRLQAEGFSNLIFRTHKELDLTNQADVEAFFEKERPEYVFLTAAKVGGIMANNTYRAEFIYDNLVIALNVIHASYKYGAKKLLNLGSSCIYPKFAPQPMKEDHLLTGPLEPTNEPYAIAKIAAIKLCLYYNEQYATNFISVMPTNLYGPDDNFDLYTSHVLPALVRKFYLGKCLENNNWQLIRRDLDKRPIDGVDGKASDKDILAVLQKYGISPLVPHSSSLVTVSIWGSGEVYREFLYVDDLADACVYLMKNYDYKDIGEFINIGTGEDIKIKDLALMIKDIVGFKGEVQHDLSKPDGTPRKLLDVSRIRSLGWRAKIDLADGIKSVYEKICGVGLIFEL